MEEAVLQDAWLRRVARALVRDVHIAEDLAQDGWVAALVRGRTQTVDRPWLGGILRNRAFSDRRREAARADRERQVARHEATLATDDVAAQLQLRELMTRELSDLEEPYRTAIYLHFVEGKSLRKVAEQLDVAVSTAHSRVAGGVDRLRQRLDGAYDGDRRAWLGLMVPWGGAATPSTAWSAGLGLAGLGLGLAVSAVMGVLMMTRPALTEGESGRPGSITAAHEADLAVPSVEALATVEAGGQRTEESGPSGAAAPTLADSIPDARPAEQTGIVPISPSADVTIRGSWNRPGGGAVSGATWTLKALFSGQRPSERVRSSGGWRDLKGTLGSDGHLELIFEPHPSQLYVLTLDHPDFVPMSWNWRSLDGGEVIELGDLTLQDPGQVLGRLVDPNGEPLGFRPWLIRALVPSAARGEGRQTFVTTTETDGEASFVFDRLPKGAIQLELSDQHLGRTPGLLVRVMPGETTVVEFPFTLQDALRDRVFVRCHVWQTTLIDELRPEQLALVNDQGVRHPGTRDPAYRDAIVFDGVGEGEFELEVDDPHLQVTRTSSIRRGESVQCLVLGRAKVQLSVTDLAGAPLEDLYVELRLVEAGVKPREGTIREGGSVLEEGQIIGMVPGDYDLVVHSGGLTGSVKVPGLLDEETRAVSVVLQRPEAIAGSVHWLDGSPVAGELVRLVTPAPIGDGLHVQIIGERHRVSEPDLYRKELAVTRTDKAGAYSLTVVEAPEVMVVAGEWPGPMVESARLNTRSTAARSGTIEPIELVLPRAARIDGKVNFPDDMDLAGWSVRFRPSGGLMPSAKGTAPVGSDGRFSVGPLTAGEGELLLSIPTKQTGLSVVTGASELPAGTRLLDTMNLEAGEVRTEEYDYPGDPLVLVDLAVTGDGIESEGALVFIGRVEGGPCAIVGVKGVADAPVRLEAGEHEVWIAGAGWVAHQRGIQIPPINGSTVAIHVEVTQQRVRVISDGRPLAGLGFALLGIPSRLRGPEYETDADGFLDLQLGAGRYVLHPSHAGISADLMLSTTTFQWPLPGVWRDLVLDPIGRGYTERGLFQK